MPVEQVALKRRLTAVLLADIVGYSRLMSVDEEGTHGRIAGYVKELIDPTVREYGGRLVRSMGDGMLVEFGSALDAVRCGLDIQQRLAERQGADKDGRIQLRIGVNTGDVIADDHDIYGNSVNITARLESIAQPGAVYVSQSIYDQTRSQPGLRFTDKGQHRVKNIDYPIRVYQVEYGQPALLGGVRLPRLLFRKRVGWAASALFGLALAAAGFFGVGDRANVLQENSIIVLPFRNLSGSVEDDYFADAITDDLTTDLSRLRRAFVIASATALTYKGKPVDARQIGRECGVQYLLEGSVRRVGNIVQINAQLIDTRTGAHVWADRFKYESSTLLELQDAVTGRIGASLDIQLVKAEVRHVTGSLAADGNPMDERLRAMALILGPPTPESYREAQRHVEDALKKDPDSADSWALLARILMAQYLNAWNNIGPKDVDTAEQAYQRALALNPSLAVAHYAGGFVRRVRADHQGALDEFEQAIKLDSNLAVAYAQQANELVFLGRAKQAVAAGKKAVSLSPRDPSIGVFYWVIGRAYFTDGNHNDAADWLEKSIVERPNLWFNRAWLISAYALTGRQKDAETALAAFKQTFPNYNLARIAENYDKERFDKAAFTAPVQQLLDGLKKAGLK